LSTPILKTKLHIPTIHQDILPRPQLRQCLAAGVHGKFTLISAAAGFGKSTLLSDWVVHTKTHTRIAWLSLDEGDNDLSRFLTYFVAALQTFERNIGQGVLVALQSPGVIKVEVVLTTLINDIAELPEDVVLILDDYHVIELNPIDQAMIFLLDHLPSQLHLVIASRIDPSFPLPRLRTRRQMTEIRAKDLRFSKEETTSFFNQVLSLDLSDQDVAALETRTEGWIAGLQLAAISMDGINDVQEFVRSFTSSNRYIFDYLGEEVLSRQNPKIQDFLLKTSILNRLTGSLCNVITDSSAGDETLEILERGNLFIIPLDNEQRWYRYHHLFADLLRRRLLQAYPDLVPKLHSQASEWYAHHNFYFDAIHHALAGKDFEMAANLIELHGLSLIGQGSFVTVQNWINALPRNIVEKRPYLCVYHGWASNFTQQLEAIEPYLQDAQRSLNVLGLPDDDEMTRDIQGHIATLRAWNARRQRDNALAIDILDCAVDCLDQSNSFVCTFANLNLGLAYLDNGELRKAASSLCEAISQGHASGNELASLIATSQLAAVLILQGRLHKAAKLCRGTIQDQLARQEKPPPSLCMIYLRLSWVLAEWNDVDGYFENLSEGIILADQIGFDSVVTAGSISMIWEKQVLAKQGAVIEFSDEMTEIIDRALNTETDVRVTQPSSENDLTKIEAQNIDVYLADDAYFEIWPGYSGIARAKKLAEDGKSEEALVLLSQIYESARTVEGIGLMIESRASEALIHQSQGDIDLAMDALNDALFLSEPEGYTRTYADRDAPMEKLLKEAAARGIMPDYTARLLAAFDAGAKGVPTPHPQNLVEPLSPRELEILELVAQGLSNREISERLFLALSTVKGHNRNIFDKLGVKRRTEAVAQAQDIGLLG